MIQTVNMILAENAGLVLPVTVSAIYVKCWPNVTPMPRLTATVGTIIGMLFATAILSWVSWPMRQLPCVNCVHDGRFTAETWRRFPIGCLAIGLTSLMSVWLVTKIISAFRTGSP